MIKNERNIDINFISRNVDMFVSITYSMSSIKFKSIFFLFFLGFFNQILFYYIFHYSLFRSSSGTSRISNLLRYWTGYLKNHSLASCSFLPTRPVSMRPPFWVFRSKERVHESAHWKVNCINKCVEFSSKVRSVLLEVKELRSCARACTCGTASNNRWSLCWKYRQFEGENGNVDWKMIKGEIKGSQM